MHDVEIIVMKIFILAIFANKKKKSGIIHFHKKLKTKVKIIRFQNLALKIYRLMKDNAY